MKAGHTDLKTPVNRSSIGDVEKRLQVWIDLEVTVVIDQNDNVETCRLDVHLAFKMEKNAPFNKRSGEETKPIPAIYHEEVSAASAEPSTSVLMILK
ncbi:hypothetical protein T4B_8496 [Trichinella pseudospiralis]|uniref:Uncharacterized protein n=1 Tax=Trichinella pseudospiralis TaxID=6337 RepID=A0A0V1HA68_TRIPS|nr:hypothetical protein T4B_8496 [Trichinella pseudospiralis]